MFDFRFAELKDRNVRLKGVLPGNVLILLKIPEEQHHHQYLLREDSLCMIIVWSCHAPFPKLKSRGMIIINK